MKFWDVPYEITNCPNIQEFVQNRAVKFDEHPFLVVKENIFFFRAKKFLKDKT